MMPSHFLLLDTMSLTANGTIDQLYPHHSVYVLMGRKSMLDRGERVQGEFSIHRLPGTHFSIVRPQNVETLA